MLFLLIRHGESIQNNGENRLQRLPDHAIPLSNVGREQAVQTGEFLKSFLDKCPDLKFRMWVSPYTRTRQTADIIEPIIKKNIIDRREHLSLVEQQWGVYDGLTDEEMEEIYPQETLYYNRCKEHQGKFWARIPLGESPYDVAIRVHEAFGTFHRDFEKKGIANNIIVSHGTAIRAFIMQWLHKSPEWYDAERNPKNCSVRMIKDTKDLGYMFTPDNQLVGHICTGGIMKGIIREYPSVLCSICKEPSSKFDVRMTKQEIDAHNATIFKKEW